MTFEEMLKQALKDTYEERAESLMKVEKKHRFSFAFRLWEWKMLRDFRRDRVDKRWTLRRARHVVAAMVTAFALMIGGTTFAAISMSGRFTFEDKVDYSKLLIETYPSDKTTFEEYYGLPEEDGRELTYYGFMHFRTMLRLDYTREDTTIKFCQRIIHEGNMRKINNEKADFEMLTLYSENDGFVLEFQDGLTSIYWIYDGYLFEITGNINKDEAIKLAHSTKIIDLPKDF